MKPLDQAGLRTTGTILDRIVARKREEVRDLHLAPDAVRATPVRDFAGALRRSDQTVALIAEVKHASPSKGVLIEPFDPAALAHAYAMGGATALSVLTDRDFFQGSLADLQAARAQASLPVLRKDFVIDAKQIAEARGAGADAVLLIVAILDEALLRDLHQAASEHGLSALVEVHSEAEMERALKSAARLIGINNRDLHHFAVDLGVTQRLARLAAPEVTLVAESGIFTRADVEAVAEAGAHAILVGESLVRAPDVAAQLRVLTGVRRMQDMQP